MMVQQIFSEYLKGKNKSFEEFDCVQIDEIYRLDHF